MAQDSSDGHIYRRGSFGRNLPEALEKRRRRWSFPSSHCHAEVIAISGTGPSWLRARVLLEGEENTKIK
jgi:hypothetical protein